MTTVAAVKAVDKLHRPSDIPWPTWKRMQTILRALARYLPDPFPSVRELSVRTRIHPATVSRLLIRAEENGFITRVQRTTTRGRWSYRYVLHFAPDPVSNATEKNSPPTEDRCKALPSGEPEVWASPTQEPQEPRTLAEANPTIAERRYMRLHGGFPNRYKGRCQVCGHTIGPRDGFLHPGPTHLFCLSGKTDESQLKEYLMSKGYEREHQEDLNPSGVIGEDPSAAQRATAVVTDPASKLATCFETLWFTEILAQYPRWREHRAMHKGPAIGYIRTQFLAKGYSPEYVEAYFDAFFDELADPNSTLDLREGQTPWQLFTGWWGRTAVPDPAIDRARREENQRIADLFESKIAAEQPLIDAARERLAALPDGEVGDPEDYRLVGWGVPVKRKFG